MMSAEEQRFYCNNLYAEGTDVSYFELSSDGSIKAEHKLLAPCRFPHPIQGEHLVVTAENPVPTYRNLYQLSKEHPNAAFNKASMDDPLWSADAKQLRDFGYCPSARPRRAARKAVQKIEIAVSIDATASDAEEDEDDIAPARKLPKPMPAKPPSDPAAETASDDDKCQICFDQLKSHVFYPCGHFYCCDYCALEHVKKPCPWCNKFIASAVKVFA